MITRLTRRLAIPLAGLLYAFLIVLLLQRGRFELTEGAAILRGISAEALSGSTPGRQALVGSAWWGPLTMLPHLTATSVAQLAGSLGIALPHSVPLAACISALIVFCAGILAMRHNALADDLAAPADGETDALRTTQPSRLLLALAAVSPLALALAAGGGGSVLTLPLAVWLVLHCGAWLATGRLRHLIPSAFAMAGLLLCGAASWGWVAFGTLMILLGAVIRLPLLKRLPALLLLALLPAVYSFGVWIALNWLIMGDGFFFLRPLGTLGAAAWGGWTGLNDALSSNLDKTAAALSAAGLLFGLIQRDGRIIGYALAGVAATAWLWVLEAFGLSWSTDATAWMLHICALLLITRQILVISRSKPAIGQTIQLALVVVMALWLRNTSQSPRMLALKDDDFDAGDILEQVQEHVLWDSSYAKVFVCGYQGMGLLQGDRHDDLFVPVMDLHLALLRNDYHGQNLYVLVHRPEDAARFESLIWRAPDFYALGSRLTLLAADFGEWRLYELITAPRSRKLNESDDS